MCPGHSPLDNRRRQLRPRLVQPAAHTRRRNQSVFRTRAPAPKSTTQRMAARQRSLRHFTQDLFPFQTTTTIKAIAAGAGWSNSEVASATYTIQIPPPGISSTASGGNWSATTTWVGGVVPTASDNVTIADGATVTINTAASALSLRVGTGAGPAAVLQFESNNPRTITVGTYVIIASNGTFQGPSGNENGHVLSVGTDLTNNGVARFLHKW